MTDPVIPAPEPAPRRGRALPADPEPTTGAPDALVSSSPTTKKRRVNDGPTGRARRELAGQETNLEGNVEPGDVA